MSSLDLKLKLLVPVQQLSWIGYNYYTGGHQEVRELGFSRGGQDSRDEEGKPADYYYLYK